MQEGAAAGSAGRVADFDAVILSGGRSSRLGGVAKATLRTEDRSLLEWTVSAAGAAGRIIVVGPEVPGGTPAAGTAASAAGVGVAEHAEYILERPRFAGPAAAVAAALSYLGAFAAPRLLVLACDMPQVSRAVPSLLEAAARYPEHTVVADDGGRQQPLAAVYSTAALRAAVEAASGGRGIAGQSMRALLDNLQWKPVTVPPGSTRDVDTWDDAAQLGVEADAGGCPPAETPVPRT
jgi:molybdopterin-guanine dinucleotide biosynthesis protein A